MSSPDMLALMIPIIALLIPIVAILTVHQQKMAKIIHGELGPQGKAELEAMRAEMHQLRMLVTQQAIEIDDLKSNRSTLGNVALSTPPSIQERLGQ